MEQKKFLNPNKIALVQKERRNELGGAVLAQGLLRIFIYEDIERNEVDRDLPHCDNNDRRPKTWNDGAHIKMLVARGGYDGEQWRRDKNLWGPLRIW